MVGGVNRMHLDVRDEIQKTVCEDGSYFILDYLYTHGDGESEKIWESWHRKVRLNQLQAQRVVTLCITKF